VIAGVIGTHKFVYDVGGDTVNTAKRMKVRRPAGSCSAIIGRSRRRFPLRAAPPPGAVEVTARADGNYFLEADAYAWVYRQGNSAGRDGRSAVPDQAGSQRCQILLAIGFKRGTTHRASPQSA